MGICYREKEFHAGKKIRKNAPSEKYSSYAPDQNENHVYALTTTINPAEHIYNSNTLG